MEARLREEEERAAFLSGLPRRLEKQMVPMIMEEFASLRREIKERDALAL